MKHQILSKYHTCLFYDHLDFTIEEVIDLDVIVVSLLTFQEVTKEVSVMSLFQHCWWQSHSCPFTVESTLPFCTYMKNVSNNRENITWNKSEYPGFPISEQLGIIEILTIFLCIMYYYAFTQYNYYFGSECIFLSIL